MKTTTYSKYMLHEKLFARYKKQYSGHDLDHLITYVIEHKKTEKDLREYINRRLHNVPLAYITGTQPFYGYEFTVDSHCLVPRQRTEYMVDALLKCPFFPKDRDMRVLDLCCGCGVIGLTLAKHRKKWHVDLADISEDALHRAIYNSKKHKIENVSFFHCDMREYMSMSYDLIVSNPPYLRTIDRVDPSITCEPHVALFSGSDGLHHTRCILSNASNHWIALEHTSINYLQFISLIGQSNYRVVRAAHQDDARYIILHRAI